jgi:ferritin-like metal-binding protein YciE
VILIERSFQVVGIKKSVMKKGLRSLIGRFRMKREQSMCEIYDEGLTKLFHYELKNIYWVEKYLSDRLLCATKLTSSKKLKEVFERHFKVTQMQALRLERVFNELAERPVGQRCKAVEIIFKESKAAIFNNTKDHTPGRDAALILAWRKIEHYEIAAYGELAKLASSINNEKISELLYLTLEEEMDEDADLMDIAKDGCYSSLATISQHHHADQPL